MALHARLGATFRLVKSHTKIPFRLKHRPTSVGFYVNKSNKPEGYEHIFVPAKDLPAPLKGPLTPEKRAELAAKYNLAPADYKPMENMGDYPELPDESAYDRDPHYDWDDRVLRRNYGEPIYYDQDSRDRIQGFDKRPVHVDYRSIATFWACLVGGFGVLLYFRNYFMHFMPIAPKQYPEYLPRDDREKNSEGPHFTWHGRKFIHHYEFEPLPNDHQH